MLQELTVCLSDFERLMQQPKSVLAADCVIFCCLYDYVYTQQRLWLKKNQKKKRQNQAVIRIPHETQLAKKKTKLVFSFDENISF